MKCPNDDDVGFLSLVSEVSESSFRQSPHSDTSDTAPARESVRIKYR